MATATWLDREHLFPAALGALEQVEVVLDIGPGIRPQNYIQPTVQICCEPFDQYVEHLRKLAVKSVDRTDLILQMTWQEAVRYLPEQSVDTVILSDVIEHLEKEEGRRLLDRTQKIVRRQIGIFTTLGFVPQHHGDGKDAWGLDGGAWQEHKSGWLPEDFGTGWKVFASREFHTTDNLGKPRPEPEGALWAIYTNPTPAESPREYLADLWRTAVATNNRFSVGIAKRLLRIAIWSKPLLWPLVRPFIRLPKKPTA